MNFWDEHSVVFIIGLIACPRILLLWFGMIPPMQFPPLLGLVFVPRMMLASSLTAAYWETNSAVVIVSWILAVIVDLVAFIFKLGMIGQSWKMQMQELQRRGYF